MKRNHFLILLGAVCLVVVAIVVCLPSNTNPKPQHEVRSDAGSPLSSAVSKRPAILISHPELLSERLRPLGMSAAEIRKRHVLILGQALPNYATELRGRATSDSTAIWVFTIPDKNREEFEQYLVRLGVPEDGLFKGRRVKGLRRIPSLKGFDAATMDASGLVYHSTGAMPEAGATVRDDYSINEQAHRSFVYRFLNPDIRDEYQLIVYFPTAGAVKVHQTELEWD